MSLVVDRTTLIYRDNQLFYARDINPEVKDPEVHHVVDESVLQPMLVEDITWTERFFYGVGNSRM